MNSELLGLRDELITRVRNGEMKPEEAEAEAERLGLEPFASKPEPSEFDPMSEPEWSLPMVVAWIAHRSVDAVREAWPGYCDRHWRWVPRDWRVGPDGAVRSGWFLEQQRSPTLLQLEMTGIRGQAEMDGQPAHTSIADARHGLWIALGEAMLPATGETASGARVRIPADQWASLASYDNSDGDGVRNVALGLDYSAPLFPAKAVTLLWGPPRPRPLLTPLVAPEGFGYMPLTCAAQWIATEGGSVDFDPVDESIWRPAFENLLRAIASDKVRVVGNRSSGREPVPGYSFAGIAVDYPYCDPSLDLMTSETIYLQCYPFTDEESWRKSFYDSLICRRQEHWTHLQVERGDIRELWPFELGARGTGAPGRPSKSMNLILDEFERRTESRQAAASLRDESNALLAWLKTTYPRRDRPALSTVENRIRKRFSQIRSTK